MKRRLPLFGLALLFLALVLYFARNTIARRAVAIGVEAVTGFPMEIASVDLSLFSSKLDVHGIKLKNPPEFTDPVFVDMPQLYVDYRLPSLLTGTHHINDMLINIEQLVLVKNAKGESNVQKLGGITTGKSGSKSSTKYRIDQLRIHIGKVCTKDYSHGTVRERVITRNQDFIVKNISDTADIKGLIFLSVAHNVHLSDFGLNTADLSKNLGGITNTNGKTADQAVETIENTGQSLLENLTEPVPQR